MNHKTLPHNHGNMTEEFIAELPKEHTFEAVSELMKMMSDGKRVQIFWLLCHCEECVINISALLEMSSSAVSHHLKLLKTAGLVTGRREGKEVYYTASKISRSHVLHEMIEQIIEVACPTEEETTSPVHNSPIDTVNEIHNLMTSDLSKRYTIEELAAKFHMNQTTLKTAFKTAYGKPIGVYMKNLRIKRAGELLCKSGAKVSEIAASVGYENQSKFTAAFKDVYGMLPREYRKAHSK